MIDFELYFLILSIIVIFVNNIIIINHARKSPINELKLIALSNIFILISFLFQFPLAVADYTRNFSNITYISDNVKIGIVLLIIGGLLWLIAIILANFNTSYKSIIYMIFIILLFVATASFNYLETGVVLRSNILRFQFQIPALLSLIGSIFTLAVIFIMKIYKFKPNPMADFHYKIYIFFLATGAILSVIFILVSAESKTQLIPNFTAFLFGSYTILATGIIIARHEELFFKSNSKLDAIIINSIDSYETLFMQNTDPNILGFEFVADVLLKLSLNLPDLLKSKKTVEFINFGDKSIFFTSGKNIVTIMIVGEYSFITSSISKYLTKKFERKFGKYISEVTESGLTIDKSTFSTFKEETDYIQRFFLKN